MISENGLRVFALLQEFKQNKTSPTAPSIPNTLSGALHLFCLEKIRDQIILPAEFDDMKIFDAICDLYEKPHSINILIETRAALEGESLVGFKNLWFLTNKKSANST